MSELFRTRRVQVKLALALAGAMLLVVGGLALVAVLDGGDVPPPSEAELVEAAVLAGDARALGAARTRVESADCGVIGTARGGMPLHLCTIRVSGGEKHLFCATWRGNHISTQTLRRCFRDVRVDPSSTGPDELLRPPSWSTLGPTRGSAVSECPTSGASRRRRR